jgi:hypothetical protein
MMRVVPERFSGVLRGISVPAPPAPDSDALREELLQTMRHTQSPEVGDEFSRVIDRDMVPYICSVAECYGAEADPEELGELLRDLIPVIMRVKYAFNTPRPWQLAPAYGLSIRRLASPSAETPAYPSGHAIQAAAACGLVASRFPSASRPLTVAAERIGQSRLELGVHYPIDVLQGLRIGRQIAARM